MAKMCKIEAVEKKMKDCKHRILLAIPLLIIAFGIESTNALLLSDLPTPSFIVDVTSFTKDFCAEDMHSSTPALFLPQQRVTLFPLINMDNTDVDWDAPVFDVSKVDTSQGYSDFYLHASVIRAKQDFVPGRDESELNFLAEIDLPPSLSGHQRPEVKPGDEDLNVDPPAKLCLGLNNHHVGGYYWARSAGSGASMEAPGVTYTETDFYQDGMGDDKGILQWSNKEGFAMSNSNDGKRSEWVNFLKVGDTVQLIPKNAAGSLLKFIEKNDYYGEGGKSIRVFGTSFQDRPLGSEPTVVCEWRCG